MWKPHCTYTCVNSQHRVLSHPTLPFHSSSFQYKLYDFINIFFSFKKIALWEIVTNQEGTLRISPTLGRRKADFSVCNERVPRYISLQAQPKSVGLLSFTKIRGVTSDLINVFYSAPFNANG